MKAGCFSSSLNEFYAQESFAARRGSAPSCFHSGDLGDIVYSLLFLSVIGPVDLILGPAQGTRQPLSIQAFRWILPLLKMQPYLRDVSYSKVPLLVDYDLNAFREVWYNMAHRERRKITNLFQCYAERFGFEPMPEDAPWISNVSPRQIPKRPVVIHRSARYRSFSFNWQQIAFTYANRMVFVGLREEYDEWTRTFGRAAEYLPVNDALEMASVIAGAQLFIGNQSFPMSLALALNKSLIQETSPNTPDCIFQRPNAVYVQGTRPVTLPDL